MGLVRARPAGCGQNAISTRSCSVGSVTPKLDRKLVNSVEDSPFVKISAYYRVDGM